MKVSCHFSFLHIATKDNTKKYFIVSVTNVMLLHMAALPPENLMGVLGTGPYRTVHKCGVALVWAFSSQME